MRTQQRYEVVTQGLTGPLAGNIVGYAGWPGSKFVIGPTSASGEPFDIPVQSLDKGQVVPIEAAITDKGYRKDVERYTYAAGPAHYAEKSSRSFVRSLVDRVIG